jgi:hypothetical protein
VAVEVAAPTKKGQVAPEPVRVIDTYRPTSDVFVEFGELSTGEMVERRWSYALLQGSSAGDHDGIRDGDSHGGRASEMTPGEWRYSHEPPQVNYQIDIPNDYNSEEDTSAAIIDCYRGDDEACENDNGQQLYEVIAYKAKEAGLIFVKSTNFGATWSGTDAQFAECRELLPAWAKRYASKIESRGH